MRKQSNSASDKLHNFSPKRTIRSLCGSHSPPVNHRLHRTPPEASINHHLKRAQKVSKSRNKRAHPETHFPQSLFRTCEAQSFPRTNDDYDDQEGKQQSQPAINRFWPTFHSSRPARNHVPERTSKSRRKKKWSRESSSQNHLFCSLQTTEMFPARRRRRNHNQTSALAARTERKNCLFIFGIALCWSLVTGLWGIL